MRFTVLSLFPDIVKAYLSDSIAAKAVERRLMDVDSVDIRDFAVDRHRTCDDAPYGGGPGMVLKPEPVARALDSVVGPETTVVIMSAAGVLLNQRMAADYACRPHVVVVCGRYEGIDQRIVDEYAAEEISVGNFVLSSGEVAALVLIDTVYRLIPGVITPESLQEESFGDNLLEYPHYTRPSVFRGRRVPEVLLSGNHLHIKQWRRCEQLRRTATRRPDLLTAADLSDSDRSAIADGR